MIRKWMVLLTCICLFSIYIPHIEVSQGQGASGGISVKNVSPTIKDIDLNRKKDTYNLTIKILDYNGWEDIKSAKLTIYDEHGIRTSSIGYSQYEEKKNSTLEERRVDDIYNIKGNVLKKDVSRVLRNEERSSIYRETCMNISFKFAPKDGRELSLIITDLNNLSATMKIPLDSMVQKKYHLTPFVVISCVAVSGYYSYTKFSDIKSIEEGWDGKR